VDKNLLNVSFAGHEKAKFMRVVPGQEKFAFLYLAISALVLAGAMTFSGIAGLTTLQTVLLLIGCLIGAWGTLFTLLEIRRITRTPTDKANDALEVAASPYASRTVIVKPPTGEPYPHHEYFTESPGLDQGQLTSRIPGDTPFIESFLSRRRSKKQAAAHQ
jgi:hypothetical protein